jgi:hypothetical protein
MLSDLRSVLEADWHDNRPPLAFFCQGGDGRVFIVEPERVGVEEKRLLVGLEFFAEHDVTSYTFVMEGTGSQKMNVLPSEASDRREMLIVGGGCGWAQSCRSLFCFELDADGKRSLGEWSSSVQVDNWVTQLLGAEARTVQ